MVFIILSELRWVHMADKLRYRLGFSDESRPVPAKKMQINYTKLYEINPPCPVPRISDEIPSLVTKTLSSSSLPVNSSATTYRLGHTLLAMSSMNWSTQPGNTPKGVQAEQDE